MSRTTSTSTSLRRRAALALTAGALLGAGLADGPVSAAPASPTPIDTEWPTVSVDPPATSTAPAARSAAAATYPLDRTFLLHSKPGSQRTIYLDLDGMTISGTRWNAAGDGHPALPAGPQPGWSLDASAAFSDTERGVVQDVWQAVAEDYAPFDVDVTTEPPAPDTLDRTSTADLVYGTTALVTGGTGDAARSSADDALCGGTCAGIAYNKVFASTVQAGTTHGSWQPALVFGERTPDAHSIADAVSHEVGHNLGLDHDGTTSAAYYGGQGAWGPIMGSPSAYPVTQWSRGEYAGANQTQDDVAIIGAASGAPQRADDAADTVASAGVLPSPAGTPSSTATISTAADVDVFSLGTCTGAVTVTATPAATFSPDVDLTVAVLDAAGRALAGPVDQPTTRSTRSQAAGLGASATYDAGTGRPLFVRVDGVGSGNPSGTGYSDYGSLGRYVVGLGGSCSATTGLPSAPTGAAATASGTSVTLTWSPPVSPGVDAVTSYVVTSDVGTAVVVPASSTRTTFTGLAPGRTYSFAVAARNSRGTGAQAWADATVVAPAAPPAAVSDPPVSVPTPAPVDVPLVATTAPRVRGTARVGSRVTVKPGAWSRSTSVTVRWSVRGAVVGAGTSYRPRAGQVGRPLSVQVTATDAEGSSVVVTLRAGRVRRR